ncbi:PREDICTED: uncharacterized protein LOC104744610 [Camelina sativa]|uniref:Uncharacterized protein LOC104744610 n=1 Tax=Camelina sativa TaxID=90675 RepID=A0ABM0W0J0_CAMSA|nr:PREDICTED: uncharacterized protein LOC104744610 [Camelina sativa]
MECNKEDAANAKQIAEEKMEAGDFVGAHKFVTRAQRLFPNLENLLQMITICDVHSAAINKIKGLENWYGILQVQPLVADADTIKKQYRKLVLLLHPDKNKFPGAEAAFKLVGEANRVLSDRMKRSQYDVRYRSHSILANRHANANSGRHCAATNNAAHNIASVHTFWTSCRHCGRWYKYLKEYMDTVMHCSSCRNNFVARSMRCDGVPPGSSTAGKKDFQYQGMYNTSRQNAPTEAESASAAAEMDKNGTVEGKLNKKNQVNQEKGADDRELKKDEGCTDNNTEGSRPQNGETGSMKDSAEIPKADVLKPQPQIKETDTTAGESILDSSAPKKTKAYKRRRKTVDESSKSFEVDSSVAAGAKTDTKGGSDGDFVNPPSKKTKPGCKSEDNKSAEQADSGVSSASSHANKGNEDILSSKNKVSGGCNGNGEDAALLSKIDRVENGYKANENPNTLDVPDPELNVFDVERNTEIFAVNQVWSTTDSRDGMPRKYVRVENVLNAEFKLRITYLEPVCDENDDCIPVACGKFKNGKTEEVENRSIFSGQMHHLLCNKIVSIYPRKGEIWAIFRGWNKEWNNSVEKHKLPYKYDFVEIVSDFDDVIGVGAAYLGKLKGSRPLFHREAKYGIRQIQFFPEDMLRFSHKVPAIKMTRKEKECVPADSYELDPAALPKYILQVDAVEMEMDSEILKDKADSPYPEAPKVGAKVKLVPETAPSPRKRRKSDDDNCVCCNLGEVKQGTNRSHDISSCEVDEKNTPNKSRKNGEATDGFKLRKSPRLQTIPSQQGDGKKSHKQGNKMNNSKKSDKDLVTDSLGVDEKNTPNKCRKNGEATDVYRLRKSPRLQTIPSQQGDEKKSAKQGRKMNNPMKTDKGLVTDSLGVDEKNTPNESKKNGEATDVFTLRKSPRLQTNSNQQGDEKESAKQGRKMNNPKKTDKGLVTDSLGVDEKNTPNESRKNGEATDVFTLRKSARLQTNSNQQGDEKKSAKQGRKMNNPKKSDKGRMTDSSGVRKSPNGIHQSAESQEGESSKKQGRNGETPSLSKLSDLPSQVDGSTYEFPNTSPVSPNCKRPRRNAFDFKNLRSEDKFGVNQVWAIYSNDKGIPSEYVKITKVETKPKFVLRGTPTKLYPPSTEPVTRPVSCGEFKLKNGRPKIFPCASFSHQVKPFDSSKMFIVKVYPRKGEIWALYKNCDSSEEHDIVEVVEDNCDGEIVKVVALTAKGSSSLYTTQRKEGAGADFIDIPKAEMSRFSHQIPAVKTRQVKGGYWELDPIAIPTRTKVFD